MNQEYRSKTNNRGIVKISIIFLIFLHLTLPGNASNPEKKFTITTKFASNNEIAKDVNFKREHSLLKIKESKNDSIIKVMKLSQNVTDNGSRYLKSLTVTEDTITINVTTPGTLLAVLGTDRLNVTNLKVLGSLDKTDIINLNTKLTSLKTLNLWDVALQGNKFDDYSFKNNKTLIGFIMPKLLTSTGIGTFYGCSHITYVVNSNLCTEIGSYAFYGCNFKRMVIGENITTIGAYAFYNCNLSDEIIISNKVVSIGTYAFYNCRFTSLTLPEPLTTIGSLAFGSCLNLKLVKVLNTVPTIVNSNDHLFNDLGSKTLIVPNGSKSTYRNAIEWKSFGTIEEESSTKITTNVNVYGALSSIFAAGAYPLNAIQELTLTGNLNADDIYYVRDNFSNLEKIDLSGANLEGNQLPERSFMGNESSGEVIATNYKTIILPNSLTSIGYAAFAHCEKLLSITLPKSLQEISTSAFWNCYELSFIIDPGNKYFKLVDDVLFSADMKTIVFYPYKKEGLSYSIPEGITTIGGGAFAVNDNLETIEFPASLTSIKASAFERIKSVGNIDLSKCSSLINVDDEAFDMGIYIYVTRTVKLPEGLQRIGKNAFYNSAMINVPRTIVSVDDYGLGGCDSMIMPNELPYLKKVGERAFNFCSGIKYFPPMAALDSIGKNAFNGCSSLLSFEIAPSVKVIGYGPFSECSKLMSINVHSDNKNFSSINGVLFNYDKTSLLTFPSGKTNTNYVVPLTVKTIGGGAFGCTNNLVSVILPNDLTTIENMAFWIPKLTSIVLPATVTKIGDNAFGGCFVLKNVTSKAIIPPINYEKNINFFRSDLQNSGLKVPIGSKDKYLHADMWKIFNSIIEEDFSTNISMNTVLKGEFGFSIKGAAENTKISVDWGDGKKIDYTIGNALVYLKSPVSFSYDTTLIRIYGENIVYLDLNNKGLISLDVSRANELKYLYCASNRIPIPLLPKISSNYLEYSYAPQETVKIPKNVFLVTTKSWATDESFDFSSYLMSINNIDSAIITTYTWKTKSGKTLIEDSDYKNFNGVFNFLNTQSDSIYCELTNSAFPEFTGTNILKTNYTKVVTLPNIVLKTTMKGNFSIYFASTYNTQTISIDWGNSTKNNYSINSTAKSIGTNLTADTSVIKIYGENIGYLNVNNKEIDYLDVSRAESLQELHCDNNKLKKLNVSKNKDLWYLFCENNKLVTLDLYYILFRLHCGNNTLTSLDIGSFTLLEEVFCENNKITNLDVSKCKDLKSLICRNNEITSLKINEKADITTLSCENNKLNYVTLPLPSKLILAYNYFPQKQIELPITFEVGSIIDLSNEFKMTDCDGVDHTTTYFWYPTELIEDIDYKVIGDGKFKFLKAQSSKVHCEMFNSVFPGDSNAKFYLKTTESSITSTTGTGDLKLQNEVNIQAIDDKIVVSFSKVIAHCIISIYDLNGKLIITKVPNTDILEIPMNKNGIYMVKVFQEDKVFSGKVLVYW